MRTLLELNAKQKISIFLIIILIFGIWIFDAAEDLTHGSSMTHIAIEGIALLVVAFWFVTVAARYFVSKTLNIQMRVDLAEVRKDLDAYRRETAHLAKGLGLKIDQQLEKWGMTKAEKEVALLVLKGFSNKEIAGLRGTSEKTVVQQVSAVYEKSGLHHRAEFAAFFLEDILLPQE